MSRTEQKTLTRKRILDAAGRGFRRGGFGGVGVDGLAKEAGVTSGAFYVHFTSKAEAFRESVAQGMQDLKSGIHHFQEKYGENWWPEFVRYYLGIKRKCDLSESCALQSLAPEVVRADSLSREVFASELRQVAAIIVSGPESSGRPQNINSAYATLATLAGAVTLARAVEDSALAEQITAAAETLLLPPASLIKTNSRKKALPSK